MKRGLSPLIVLKNRNCFWNTRGISPLIATILLIGMVVVTSAVVLMWGSGFMEMLTEGTGEKASQNVFTMHNVRISISNAKSEEGVVTLTVSNTGNNDIKAKVNLIGEEGVQIEEINLNKGSMVGKIYVSDVGDIKKNCFNSSTTR
jgi:flagellin-like protein